MSSRVVGAGALAHVPRHRARGMGVDRGAPRHSRAPPSCCAAQVPVDDGVGVVIVDHGSRRPESNDMLHEFASLYK